MKESDKALFRNALGKVSPIKKGSSLPKQQRSLKIDQKDPAYQHLRETAVDFKGAVESHYSDQAGRALTAQSELSFYRAGIQLRVFKKLRQGKFQIEASLDLHGNTVEQARVKTQQFVQMAVASDMRCVLIIHGKGRHNEQQHAVLKTQVNHWLQQEPHVLAFHSAKDSDGGLGAVYVLLRKANHKPE